MLSRKGFTLIELMVVVLIVAILAAVAIPVMRGRLEAAKWSEGKAIMGTIGSSIRAYAAEKGTGAAQPNILASAAQPNLGFQDADLKGTYFLNATFSITAYTAPTDTAAVIFTIKCLTTDRTPLGYTLTSLGVWTEVSS